jgi:hypothetical protein
MNKKKAAQRPVRFEIEDPKRSRQREIYNNAQYVVKLFVILAKGDERTRKAAKSFLDQSYRETLVTQIASKVNDLKKSSLTSLNIERTSRTLPARLMKH